MYGSQLITVLKYLKLKQLTYNTESANAEGTFMLKWKDEKAEAMFVSISVCNNILTRSVTDNPIHRKASELPSEYPFAFLGFARHLLICSFLCCLVRLIMFETESDAFCSASSGLSYCNQEME